MDTPFLGTAYSLESRNLAHQEAINIYLEMVEDTLGKASEPGGFFGTPGLTRQDIFGSGPIRGMRVWNNALWVVSGNTLYQSSVLGSHVSIGTIQTSSGPVTMLDNGNAAGGAPGGQLGIFDGSAAYVYPVGGPLAQIALPAQPPFAPPIEQDGFVLLPQAGTQIVWQCNDFDMTTWNPLAFSLEDGSGDNIVALGELHRQVYVLLEGKTAIWVNVGASPFAFQRLDGPYLEVGCVAPNSLAVCGERLVWLSRNRQGQAVVVGAAEYQAERLSTYAIEQHFQTFPTVSDAVGYSYQLGGHLTYVISFPSAGETWALDLSTTSQLGYPAWNRWAYFSNGVFGQHRGIAQALWNGLNLVGDYQNGHVYSLDRKNNTDDGQPIKRVRTWRALPKTTPGTVTYKSLEVFTEQGIQTPQGLTPKLMLEISDDGGHSFGAQPFFAGGQIGQTTARTKFWRLGSTRRGMASDRSFRLSQTDNAKCAWLGAIVNE